MTDRRVMKETKALRLGAIRWRRLINNSYIMMV
jgi:hypothetical protein